MAYKILIVDDEKMMTELLSDHLQDCGYDTLTASDSNEAMQLLQKQPDLIILDINMPGMDGLELCRLMQASIAHDLRNPIAIVEGYTEYLQFHLADGKLSGEKIGRIANNLNMAAKQLARYTESVRTLNQLEDLEINRTNVLSRKLVEDICDDLEMMASNAGFSDRVLERRNKLFLPTQESDGHLGMGLTVSRLLCEKHGGSLRFFNSGTQGATVKIILEV